MSILPWHKDKLVAFDVETTGTNVHTDRIVTAAVVYMAGILRPKPYTWVIQPGIDIPDEAAQVHGWTTDRLAAHPGVMDPDTALYEIHAVLGRIMAHGIPLVAMNAAYDLTILDTEARRYDITPLSERLPHGLRPVIDPMVVDKQMDPYRPAVCGTKRSKCQCGAQSKRLDGLCCHYGVLLGDAHTADADAIAAGRLVARLVDRYPVLATCSPDELHDAQIDWRREQMDSLRAYFDKQGTVHDGCDGSWPLIPAPATTTTASEQGALL